MTIDTSGKWWVGSDASDIQAYLIAYASPGYNVEEFRLAHCACGSVSFQLLADEDEGVAKRICERCKAEHFLCDSEDFWSEARPEKFICIECGSEACNIGAGFSLYEDDESAIKWIYVGERCIKCGVLGCFAGWKVGCSQSLHLMEQV